LLNFDDTDGGFLKRSIKLQTIEESSFEKTRDWTSLKILEFLEVTFRCEDMVLVISG